MAKELGKTVEEISEMDAYEFEEWKVFFKLKSEFEEKAIEEAKQKAKNQ
ncbi:hypothetical protein [Alkalithermobacter thermoalcaliphilus]